MAQSSSDDARLAEYTSLRHEAAQRSAFQQGLVALNLAVAGSVAGFALAEHGREELFLTVALASPVFGLLWIDHHLSIHQIAEYVRNELWDWAPSWERWSRDHGKPRWWQLLYVTSIVLVFAGASVAALAISLDESDGGLRLLWIAALVLAIVQLCSALRVFTATPGHVK
jgi:hypothetical protein